MKKYVIPAKVRHGESVLWRTFAGMTTLLFLSGSLAFAAPKPGDFFASGPIKEKQIALTFDDGPGPWTEKFLDLLDKYQVKATFFMEGDQTRYRSKIAKMVAERGHEVGSHTLKHTNYLKRFNELKNGGDDPGAISTAKQELQEDMKRSREIIEKATGLTLRLCRMPHGIDRPWIHEAAKEAGFILVNWTYGADWTQTPLEDLKKSYVQAIKPGAILLFHDGGRNRENSLILTEAVLQAAKEQGYEIVPTGKLVGL